MSAVVLTLAIGVVTLLPAEDTGARMRIAWSTTPIEFLANVLLFMPLFVVVGRMITGWRRPLTLALVGTVVIESLQLLVPGRQASVFDIVANVSGAALALAITRRRGRSTWTEATGARVSLVIVVLVTLGMVAVDHVGARFAPTGSQPYVQITPRLSWLAHATWAASDVRLRNLTVRRGPIDPSRGVASASCGGGRIDARIRVDARSTSGWAPLVRVADEHGETLTVLAEWHGALLLAHRTVARTWGAPHAWHTILARTVPGETLAVTVECHDELLSWQVSGTTTSRGVVDMRFGHLARSLTSSLLVPRNADLLLLPLILGWLVIGALCGWLLPAAQRGAGARWSVPLLGVAMLPGIAAWLDARGDARVAVVAWTASIVVSFFVARARTRP